MGIFCERMRASRARMWRLVCLAVIATAFAGAAHAQRVTMADFKRAESLFGQGQYAEARKLYEAIAGDTAYSPAQFRLGWIFHNGLGTQVDCGAAARWYTFAAGQKDATAAYNLYSIYESGCEGFPVDAKRARQWLERASALNNPVGMVTLAQKMVEESGDVYAAYDLVQRAAISDDGYATTVLGVFTADGNGIPADFVKARQLLIQAWHEPSVYSQHKLMTAAYLGAVAAGNGETNADPEESLKWYLVAKRLGGSVDAHIAEVAPLVPEQNRSRLESEARRLASDTSGTVLSNEELFYAALLSTNVDPGQALALANELDAAGDRRAPLLHGLMAMKGVGGLADPDEALVYFKRGCTTNSLAVSCAYYGSALLDQNRVEEAQAVLRPLAAQTSDAEVAWTPELRLRLGQVLAQAALLEESRIVARSVLAADTDNAAALKLLGE